MKKILSSVFSPCELNDRMLILYFLNLSDYLFTLILISSGLFMEANPLLSLSINGSAGFFAKCVLPAAMLIYIKLRITSGEVKHMLAAKVMLDIAAVFYFAVNCMHVFWLSYSIAIFS